MFGGFELAGFVWVLGSGCGACTRSSSCLAFGAGNRVGVDMMVGGIVLAVAVFCDCLVWAQVGLALGRQAAWRPGCTRVVLS